MGDRFDLVLEKMAEEVRRVLPAATCAIHHGHNISARHAESGADGGLMSEIPRQVNGAHMPIVRRQVI